jgi:ATP-binding cassette, subfamily B, bacterial PglK
MCRRENPKIRSNLRKSLKPVMFLFLSGGQRQQIGLARALYGRPEILVLDEATSALGNRTESDLMRAVESLGRDITLIIVAHRITTVEKCDQIILLEHGYIRAQCTFNELRTGDPTFQRLILGG